jgi:8-oxo-dGTP pyrophosphatase MutT (NUDIX family)
MSYFDDLLTTVLVEQTKQQYRAAVAIAQYKDKWLLGLSTADDDRNNKWCFPGGGVKRGEDAVAAAVRECWEETGIKCKAVGEPFCLPTKPDVCFVHCKITNGSQKFDNNNEFSGLGLFDKHEMRALKLYPNVLKLIDRVK